MNSMALVSPSSHAHFHDYCLGLVGVRSVTWWDSPNTGSVVVLLRHTWWTWRALRDKNRRRAEVAVVKTYGPYVGIEVL